MPALELAAGCADAADGVDARAYFLFDALPVFDDASLAAAMDDLSARLRRRVSGGVAVLVRRSLSARTNFNGAG